MGADFYGFSAYKLFGPHCALEYHAFAALPFLGILGSTSVARAFDLAALDGDKVSPAITAIAVKSARSASR